MKGLAFSPMIEYAIGHGPKSPVFIPRTLAAEAIQEPFVEWRGTTAALAKTEEQFERFRFPPSDDHPGIRMVWNENGSQPGSWGHGYGWLEALRNPRIEMVVGVTNRTEAQIVGGKVAAQVAASNLGGSSDDGG